MISISKDSVTSAAGLYWYKLAFSGTSDWIQLPPGMTCVSVAIHPAAGQTARIEFSLSSWDDLAAGTARWITWDSGNTTASAADGIMTLASAIRGVASGGTATLELVAR